MANNVTNEEVDEAKLATGNPAPSVQENEVAETELQEEAVASADDDMEEPETKNYNPTPKIQVYFKQEFKDALEQTVGSLSHNYIMGTPYQTIQVGKFFDLLDTLMGKPLTEKEANDFINIAALAPHNVIGTVLKNIQTNQALYFDVRQA